jgi:hypothetical protein
VTLSGVGKDLMMQARFTANRTVAFSGNLPLAPAIGCPAWVPKNAGDCAARRRQIIMRREFGLAAQ